MAGGVAVIPDTPYLVRLGGPEPGGRRRPLNRATLAAVDGYADLAVLRIDAAADGEPLSGPLQLTNVPLGALAEPPRGTPTSA